MGFIIKQIRFLYQANINPNGKFKLKKKSLNFENLN